MTQIVGFVGKKQSGKNTSCNFLLMLKFMEARIADKAFINNDGEIEVSNIFEERIPGKEFFTFKEPHVNTKAVIDGLNRVRIYALADYLKQIAIEVFGLPREKVYGSDKDKSELTTLRWENMPGVTTNKKLFDDLASNASKSSAYPNFLEPFVGIRQRGIGEVETGDEQD